MQKFTTLTLLLFLPCLSFSQETNVNAFDAKYLNWYNLDFENNQILGASVERAYKELPANKKAKTVIVAVIDSGVDTNNADLKGHIWVNEKEIPGNNIDDDKNGYVDDINGWNFLGNSKGEEISYETLEYTRIYKLGEKNKDYPAAKKIYEAIHEKKLAEKESIANFEKRYAAAMDGVKLEFGITPTKIEDLTNISSKDETVQKGIDFLNRIYKNGFTPNDLTEIKAQNADYLERRLNVDFNPRAIIGDNPEDIKDTHYGNSNVAGPMPDHGTGVAGIIAGLRHNDLGIDGIATDVKIMVLRSTPKGDERDKDVALAIRYAVANGAQIINMSFGKAFSPQKKFVDDAIKFAERKNVLVIHAAGNDGKNIDEIESFPTDYYLDNTEATNFLNVGASSMEKNDNIAAIFSNYGQKHVAIFAPGTDIVGLDINNTFSKHDGTSDAAPVVTGVAALILSYYPNLTPKQVIAILMESATNLADANTLKPDLEHKDREMTKFGQLSKSGGIVNAAQAMKKAATYK